MKKIGWLLLLLSICLSGCGKIEMNTASIPLGIGTDIQDDQIIISAQMANPSSPEKPLGNAPQFKVITASGKTFSEAVRNTSLSFSTIPLWSHIQLSILGENLAREGITPLIDFLARNRYARKNNQLVISHKATPEQILNVKPILEPYSTFAIKNVLKIQEAQLGIYTPTDTTELLKRMSNPGIEFVAPMITITKIGQEEQILMKDMAVFKGSKMIGTLNEMESRGYRLMQPKMMTGGLFLVPSPLDDGHFITLEISRSQAKIIPQLQGNEIKMQITIKAEGNFYEQGGGGNLFSPEMFKEIGEAANQELERQMLLCIRKSQALNSDILGWGQLLYRSDPEAWKGFASQWDQIFPGVGYEVKVKFDLRRSYLTDKSFVFQ